MPVSQDISSILNDWAYDPDDLQARIIDGEDGRKKLQMRIDLGLIQMELSGRPDGLQPEGDESLLDALETRALELGPDETLDLDTDTCEALMREGIQYYHRYLALFRLSRYDLVARDTSRNLRLFAFVVKHARRRADKLRFDQYRPYVLMMRARALGSLALDDGDHPGALERVDEAIAGIRGFLTEYEQSEDEIDSSELSFLLRWRKQIELERPVGPVERLEQQLALAIAREEFEDAARIRDQLKNLRSVAES